MNKRLSSIASLLIVLGVGTTVFQTPPSLAAEPPSLAAHGPWMVYSTLDDQGNSNGLWAANQDGSAPTQLVRNTSIVALAAAPEGGYMAYVSAKYPLSGVEALKQTLNLLTLPDGGSTVITPLTNATTEPDGVQRDFAAEAVGDMQWAPNGQMLAFTGAQGTSTSSDLYIYSLATKKVTQLSSGDSQAISPNWSPDGKYIVHFGVDDFGSGAGKVMAGAWAAKADGSGVISLYQPKPDDGGFGFVGWTGPTTFITDSWNVQCGNKDLRTFDITTKQTKAWYSGPYDSVAWSPTGQSILLDVGDYTSDPNCQVVDPPGLYIWTPARPTARLVAPVKASDSYRLQWSPIINRFLVEDDDGNASPSGVITIQPDGTTDGAYATPMLPSIAPDGKNIAWISDHTLNVSNAKDFNPVKVASSVDGLEWLP